MWVAYFMPLLFNLSAIVQYAVCYLLINCTVKGEEMLHIDDPCESLVLLSYMHLLLLGQNMK